MPMIDYTADEKKKSFEYALLFCRLEKNREKEKKNYDDRIFFCI
jgi:hypothetical protein